jgi:hypothetical protein
MFRKEKNYNFFPLTSGSSWPDSTAGHGKKQHGLLFTVIVIFSVLFVHGKKQHGSALAWCVAGRFTINSKFAPADAKVQARVRDDHDIGQSIGVAS